MSIPFTYAFQPIVDLNEKKVFSYEALIRGRNSQPPEYIFSKIDKKNLLEFDQQARDVALNMAASLGIDCYINLNFSPGCLQCSGKAEKYISATLATLQDNGLSNSQLIIEITEEEIIQDQKTFGIYINKFRGAGIKVALDDFGAGYSGLNLLVNFQPDIIKLDMQLIRNIETYGPRQAIVKAIVQACISLGIDVIAEGVETLGEYHWLRSQEIYLFQGYLLAKPGFECLPHVNYPEV